MFFPLFDGHCTFKYNTHYTFQYNLCVFRLLLCVIFLSASFSVDLFHMVGNTSLFISSENRVNLKYLLAALQQQSCSGIIKTVRGWFLSLFFFFALVSHFFFLFSSFMLLLRLCCLFCVRFCGKQYVYSFSLYAFPITYSMKWLIYMHLYSHLYRCFVIDAVYRERSKSKQLKLGKFQWMGNWMRSQNGYWKIVFLLHQFSHIVHFSLWFFYCCEGMSNQVCVCCLNEICIKEMEKNCLRIEKEIKEMNFLIVNRCSRINLRMCCVHSCEYHQIMECYLHVLFDRRKQRYWFYSRRGVMILMLRDARSKQMCLTNCHF